jgi:hypothetical protein
VVLPLVALLLGRLLPAEGVGLAIRLAAAAACVLLLPGALVVRAIGWPAELGAAVAAALAWSLGVLLFALAVTFLADGSLWLTLAIVAGIAALALARDLAARRERIRVERFDAWSAASVALVGAAIGGILWWSERTIRGDALFHLARVRKLDAFATLHSLHTVDEFKDGGLHPGYAVPLWHAALALVARLADVDPAQVVLHLSAILTPLVLVLAYAVGKALFRSWGAGIATAVLEAALLGFGRRASLFAPLDLPATAARLLLVPALFTLVFAAITRRSRLLLASVGAAALALAVVHPTYALFAFLVLAGFFVARLLLAREDRAERTLLVEAFAAAAAPVLVFAVWLWPIVTETASHTPHAVEKARALRHYAHQLDVSGGSYSLAPEFVARGGPLVGAALLAVPLAFFAARRRWAAFVLGGSLVLLLIAFVRPVFTALGDLMSISQAVRIPAFLPLALALAGAAVLVARWRLAGVVLAVIAGVLFQVLYPNEFPHRPFDNGPAWAAWIALAGGAVALLLGLRWRRSLRSPAVWTAAAATAFVLPAAVDSARDLRRDPLDRYRLTPGLVHALRTVVRPGQIVFADGKTSYRIAAYAPVYVADVLPRQAADTKANRPYERFADARRFFRTGDLAIPRRYHAQWIVIERPSQRDLPLRRAYADARYALYRL